MSDKNPYITSELSKLSKTEKTRNSVHPFFYPPPALLWMGWSKDIDLSTSVRIFFWINQLLFATILFQLYRRLKLPPWFLGFALLTFSPVHNTIYMGQANLIVLLFLSLAILYRNGLSLSLAAMSKMSPALIFFQAAIMKQKRFVISCVLGVFSLSLISLFIVPLSHQIYFYDTVLPSFASGNYHELRVPIDIPANHSIPNIFHQVWPGKQGLSDAAKWASSFVNISGLAAILLFSRRYRSDRIGCMAMMVVWLTIFPAYTYEHHLSLLLFPFAVCLKNVILTQNIHCFVLLFVAYFWAALPLNWLKAIQRSIESELFHWLLQESKFFASLLLMLVLLYSIGQKNMMKALGQAA